MKWTQATAVGLSIAALFMAVQDAAAQSRSERALASLRAGAGEHVPGELIVQFRRDANESQRTVALQRIGAFAGERLRGALERFDNGGDLELFRLPPGLSTEAALTALSNLPGVDFVEPNWVVRHFATSNDTYYTNGSLWGMYGDASSPANAFGSQAAEAWARGNTCGGSTVYVGVIDEGLMVTHTDLQRNVWVNPFDPVDGIDNDGNGYVDDVNGWDFAGNNRSVYDGAADDHGTHVAGTIGAVGGNAAGVAGVCWTVKLISAKFLGANGGTTANAIKAVDYITDLKRRHGLNIVATNNSWGGGGFSQALADAIERANQADILFVAAAGNSSVNIDTSPSYPAAYANANIISVASITSTGALSSFSNYGATRVDIGAPGSSIWSTVPSRNGGSSYASYSGTSMATPHVTGAAAMYKAANPTATGAQIKAAILNSAIPTPSLQGRVVTGGRLNVSGF